jgi:hypothetical protein
MSCKEGEIFRGKIFAKPFPEVWVYAIGVELPDGELRASCNSFSDNEAVASAASLIFSRLSF